jgi:hypothetical protein
LAERVSGGLAYGLNLVGAEAHLEAECVPERLCGVLRAGYRSARAVLQRVHGGVFSGVLARGGRNDCSKTDDSSCCMRVWCAALHVFCCCHDFNP